MKKIVFENVENFSTQDIFECGQCFRWTRNEDGSYTVVAGRNIARISDEAGRVSIEALGGDEAFWRNYLDLDRDYGQIQGFLASRDDKIQQAITYGKGIRILKQERWEMLASFIISANNNIPRIKKNIRDFSEKFGEFIGEFEGELYYSFPTASVLAGLEVEDLASIKLGYRASYLIKTARMVLCDGCVCEEKLLDYVGVGPKVADCIRLFGFGRMDSFPIDTWVRQVMEAVYGLEHDDTKGILRFAQERFGEYGGMAQQYLFYFMRENSKK